jgi:hypothetical protein
MIYGLFTVYCREQDIRLGTYYPEDCIQTNDPIKPKTQMKRDVRFMSQSNRQAKQIVV